MASTQTRAPSLDNSHCDAYRDTTTSARTPKGLGSVDLRFDISPQGDMLGAEIVEHTTTRYFAHAAQESFSKC